MKLLQIWLLAKSILLYERRDIGTWNAAKATDSFGGAEILSSLFHARLLKMY
jgi:hypothetical protein